MVSPTYRGIAYTWDSNCIWRKFGYRSVYLYLILRTMQRAKHIETILVLVLALGVTYWFTGRDGFLIASGVLGVLGLFFPWIASKIHYLWMKLAEAMGFVMSKILLSIVFFLVLLPMSALGRIFKMKNSIKLKPEGKSYFVERDFTYDKKSIEDVW